MWLRVQDLSYFLLHRFHLQVLQPCQHKKLKIRNSGKRQKKEESNQTKRKLKANECSTFIKKILLRRHAEISQNVEASDSAQATDVGYARWVQNSYAYKDILLFTILRHVQG